MKEIENEIYHWSKRNGLTKKSQRIALIEAFRRVNEYHYGNVNDRLILLEFPSMLKDSKEFFIPISTERKRELNWYSLTTKGKEVIRDLNIQWTTKINQQLFYIV